MTEHLDPLSIANEKIDELTELLAAAREDRDEYERLIGVWQAKAGRRAARVIELEKALDGLIFSLQDGDCGRALNAAVRSAKRVLDDPVGVYRFGEIPTPPEVQDMVRDAINGEGEFS